jgi:hypothetical protein
VFASRRLDVVDEKEEETVASCRQGASDPIAAGRAA